MNIINVLNIMDRINRFFKPIKEWFFENHSNPLLWIACIGLGVAVFNFTYNALQKEK